MIAQHIRKNVQRIFFLFFFTLVLSCILSVSALAQCIDAESGMTIDHSTTLCQSRVTLHEPLRISSDNVSLVCEGTTFEGAYAGTGLVLLHAQRVTLQGCSFQGFRDAIFVDRDSSLQIISDVRISDSVNGVSREIGGEIISGEPQFDNVVKHYEEYTSSRKTATLLGNNISYPSLTREQRTVLFSPSGSVIDEHIRRLGLDSSSQRFATARVSAFEKNAYVSDGKTRIELSFRVQDDRQHLYVYESLGAYALADAGDFSLFEPHVLISELPTAKGTYTLTYSIAGVYPTLDEIPPVTLFSMQSPFSLQYGAVLKTLGLALAFALVAALAVLGVKKYFLKGTAKNDGDEY